MNKLNTNWIIVVAMILLAAAMRVLPHYYNFTPIAAMGLLAAAYFNNRTQSFLIPFAALLLSDIYVYSQNNFETYPLSSMLYNSFFVYAAIGISILLGQKLLKKVNIQNVVMASLASSFIFFVVTNFGTFMEGILYPRTFAGLINCFTMAIPFYKFTWLGDLLYCSVFFGVYELVKVKSAQNLVIEN